MIKLLDRETVSKILKTEKPGFYFCNFNDKLPYLEYKKKTLTPVFTKVFKHTNYDTALLVHQYQKEIPLSWNSLSCTATFLICLHDPHGGIQPYLDNSPYTLLSEDDNFAPVRQTVLIDTRAKIINSSTKSVVNPFNAHGSLNINLFKEHRHLILVDPNNSYKKLTALNIAEAVYLLRQNIEIAFFENEKEVIVRLPRDGYFQYVEKQSKSIEYLVELSYDNGLTWNRSILPVAEFFDYKEHLPNLISHTGFEERYANIILNNGY